FFERTWRGVHARVRIADLRESLRNRQYGKIGWLTIGDLIPMQRSGHAGVGERADGIRGACRPILRVLVVVEKHAMALLFPPFRGSQSGRATLDCARKRNRRPA